MKLPLNGELNQFCSYRNLKLQTQKTLLIFTIRKKLFKGIKAKKINLQDLNLVLGESLHQDKLCLFSIKHITIPAITIHIQI